MTIKNGDTVTISGVYQRRTFMQWLLKKPRKLQVFVLKDVSAKGKNK